VKRSVDQLFMHHFHNFFRWGSLEQRCPEPRWETFVSRPPNLPSPGKKYCGRPWSSRGSETQGRIKNLEKREVRSHDKVRQSARIFRRK